MAEERRKRNNGSVYRRNSDGLWAGAIVCEDGKRKYVYAKTKEGIELKLEAKRQELGLKDGVPQHGSIQVAMPASTQPVVSAIQPLSALASQHARIITVHELLAEWLETKTGLKVKTRESYELEIRRAIAFIGQVPLAELTQANVQDCLDGLQSGPDGLAPRSIKKCSLVIRAALQWAVRKKRISENPAVDLRLPRIQKSRMITLKQEELHHLLHVSREDWLHPLWALFATTGVRLGEALGLSWRDVDLREGTICIQGALQRQRERGYVLIDTKTVSSNRTIKLLDEMVDILTAHRERQMSMCGNAQTEWVKKHRLVFTNKKGGHLKDWEVRAEFKKLLARAGLPTETRVHDLRHSVASILLRKKIAATVVQEILGHSDVRTTIGIYGHVFPGMHQEAIQLLKDLLEPSKENGA
ncbi:MAG: tyrosine-type recombinase/integrase [Chloroflexota bacterium]